jgi:TatD DNase family protein
LLHRRARTGDEGDWSRPVDLVHGHFDLKKSEALRELAAELPADRIMVETDSPYLAPGKFRGKRNEPSYVVEVAKVLAETRGVSLEEISRQTTENFFRLFSRVPAPKAAA